MMILVLTHMVIPAQAGMMQMNLQDLMDALVAMMMMTLMLLQCVVHVVEDQLVDVLL
jgi:hypothetical protein